MPWCAGPNIVSFCLLFLLQLVGLAVFRRSHDRSRTPPPPLICFFPSALLIILWLKPTATRQALICACAECSSSSVSFPSYHHHHHHICSLQSSLICFFSLLYFFTSLQSSFRWLWFPLLRGARAFDDTSSPVHFRSLAAVAQ